MSTIRARRVLVRCLLAAAVLAAGGLVAGCGGEEEEPRLAMPDLVGMSIGAAEAQTYDVLHTSLIYYDLAPLDRDAGNDWVVVATTPAAGATTPKYEKVYAFALRKSEYDWFSRHAAMPTIPARADVAALLAPGGLLADVKDLVQVRYAPGAAPRGAQADPVDRAAFDPDRGLRPDLATEPPAEWRLRAGLLAAPRRGTVSAGTRPAASTPLRAGQLLVLLVRPKPAPRPAPPETTPDPDRAEGRGSSGSSGSGSGGSGSGGSGAGLPGLPGGFPTKIPGCPRRICG